ncbi:SUKH-3 domain-containing protein [Sandaracinus amylolyticus]|nr:SUKH-3 domain-containing protein [Sandaracinus amylolyticus]
MPETEVVLRGAGWYPGRSADLTSYAGCLRAWGLPWIDVAAPFLRELGGLRIPCGSGVLSIDPCALLAYAQCCEDIDWIRAFGDRVDEPVIAIGSISHGQILQGSSGRVYAHYDGLVLLAGATSDAAIDALVRDVPLPPADVLPAPDDE